MEEYNGFEIGAIRPPSEAESLLIRVTRNCPWNKCTFCSLYKGERFSIRSKEHIFKDIDLIKTCIETFKKLEDVSNVERQEQLRILRKTLGSEDRWAFQSAWGWYQGGMESIFLQDANSLVMKSKDLIEILNYIKVNLPDVKRITSYARSHTIARIKDEELKAIGEAGLNRIHIGMETGADKVLTLVKKGVDKATHIVAGQKVKRANIQLSEYFMPGLGGNEYSKENALETANALNQINPDFIRIRTLAVTKKSELIKDYDSGTFSRTNDTKMVEELYQLVKSLDGITSRVKSDHILNLIPEAEGTFPEDKQKILSVLKWFLDLEEEEKMIFRVGRRTGVMGGREDLYDTARRERTLSIMKENYITLDNVDSIVDELMNRFI